MPRVPAPGMVIADDGTNARRQRSGPAERSCLVIEWRGESAGECETGDREGEIDRVLNGSFFGRATGTGSEVSASG